MWKEKTIIHLVVSETKELAVFSEQMGWPQKYFVNHIKGLDKRKPSSIHSSIVAMPIHRRKFYLKKKCYSKKKNEKKMKFDEI